MDDQYINPQKQETPCPTRNLEFQPQAGRPLAENITN
jgi:hypothetical protein